MSKTEIRIGGACGFWGDSALATPQLLSSGGVDYIVYDYLAEITMSIAARAKAKNPEAGYATDFVSVVLKHSLPMVAASGVKLIANAGGVNVEACAKAARDLIADAGLNLKVAAITGDDLTSKAADIAASAPTEMFSGAAFPDPDKIASINAYLGAFPIAKALAMGADIVITGRCVDSALTLGACIHEFGWNADDYDRLAAGSLAGHIIECGPQATGGNFTDWREVGDIAEIGYPIATVTPDGAFTITKPDGTSGLVSVGTVSEQMLYEIGDPQAYMLPDVICDFSGVEITQESPGKVRVTGAKGRAPTDTYKTCATYADGFRTGMVMSFYGFDAADKAKAFGEAAFAKAEKILRFMNAGAYSEKSIEILGAGSQFGEHDAEAREVTLKIAAKHPSPIEGGVLLKELSGLGLATAPGLSGFVGARPKPSPVVRLYSYLTPKPDIAITIECDGDAASHKDATGEAFDLASIERPSAPEALDGGEMVSVPLIKLAWGRSGDKGDKANIGVIARKAEYLPYIWAALAEDKIAECFAHFIGGGAQAGKVERFFLPGSNAVNFLIDNVLGGGGVASIRNDPQGKGYAQILLAQPIDIPEDMAKAVA